MIIADLLYSATKAFLNADIENPQRNAEILLSYLLDCSIGEIYLSKEIELDIEKFKCSIQQKIEGEPWAYIFNSVQFRNLELKIKKGVFIPRPETELLVEEAERIVLRWLGHTKHAVDFPSEEIMAQVSIGNFSIADTRNWCSPSPKHRLRRATGQALLVPVYPVGKPKVYPTGLGLRNGFLATQSTSLPNNFSLLDIGTGCGNIAISLAKNFPFISVLATDISKTALKIAKLNALRYNLKNISFLYSDLFKNIPRQKFNIIVSNPPYIPSGDLKTLPEEVQREPRSALEGGEKGISFLSKIIKNVPHFLKKGGYLILEIGISQDNLIKKIIVQSKLELIKIVKDYQKIPRIAILRKNRE